MNLLLEAIFVGIYSCILYIGLSYFISNLFYTFLITGFIKHFLGYYLGIQSVYCKIHVDPTVFAIPYQLILLSFLEAGLYLIVGTSISSLVSIHTFFAKYGLFFGIGFLLHFFAKNAGIHAFFLKNVCKRHIKSKPYKNHSS